MRRLVLRREDPLGRHAEVDHQKRLPIFVRLVAPPTKLTAVPSMLESGAMSVQTSAVARTAPLGLFVLAGAVVAIRVCVCAGICDGSNVTDSVPLSCP